MFTVKKATRRAWAAMLAGAAGWPIVCVAQEKVEKGEDEVRREVMQPVPVAPNGAQPVMQPAPQPGAPVGVPGAQPAPVIGPQDVELGPVPAGHVRIGPYSEPVDVKLLIDFVASKMKIQIIASDIALADKKVWLLTPVDVPEARLLEFLSYLLERNGQFLTKEADFVWVIKPVTDTSGEPREDPLATTQVLPTKGLKPSSLGQAITTVLGAGVGGGAPGVPQGQVRVTYMDDLGVLIINDTPRRIGVVKTLIERLASEQIDLQFTRFAVKHISAVTAKARILELLGRFQRNVVSQVQDPNNPGQFIQQGQGGGAGGASSNVADRLVPEGNSNALVLRGRPEEVTLIQRLLDVVDVPNALVPKWYPVGPAAFPLAEQAKRQGLGDVTVLQSTRGGGNANQGFDPNNPQVFQQQRSAGSSGDQSGPVFVLDPEQRGFMYYGTPDQHERVQQLVQEFREPIQAERVVYEFYKLRFADAEKTAEVIRGMITNTVPAGESPLVPGQGGGQRGRASAFQPGLITPEGIIPLGGGGEDGIGEIVASDQVFVLPDKANNQVIVKAPSRLQAQFQRLIDRLDQRRAQVYIDAKIVVVSDDNRFNLAIESAINDSGTNGLAARTSFINTLTSNPTSPNGQPLLNAPIVTPALGGGLTAALIKSDKVPVIIRALATTGDSRLIASPQLLVDDNEEAELSSISQEPTTTSTQSGSAGSTATSFGGYQDAGPRLKIKPRISSGELLSLEYEIELSSFGQRQSSDTNIPPPRNENKVSSKSTTIPSDSTIVVGGLVFEDARNTVARIPLIGDIPLIGEAFKSRTHDNVKRTVYVFITPRIMRDPTGNDLRLFSKGPAAGVKINTDLPAVKPEPMEIVGGLAPEKK